MIITITMDLDDDYADPEHPMGVTEEGHIGLQDALAPFGSNIEVSRS
jgi:hypothetical protein